MKPYYDHKGITIYHGDCLEIMPQLEPVDLVLTDPPYGTGFDFTKKRSRTSIIKRGYGPYKTKDRDWENYKGNNKPFDPVHLLGINKIIIWGANNFADKLPARNSWLVWDKKAHTNSDNHGDCELAWTNLSIPIRRYTHLWRGIVRSGRENPKFGEKFHPSQKPQSLIEWCLNLALPFDIIIDPYMGSGTTLCAAKEMNKKAIGIEIEEKYCEIAARRLAQEMLPFGSNQPVQPMPDGTG
jgi:site-specific DNA-methyltransferase (adenine-specific)